MESSLKFKSVVILVFLFGSVVYGQPWAGSGDANDPYQIWTAGQMNEIGLHPEDWDKYFHLMADIDLSGYPGRNYNIIGRQVTVSQPFEIALDITSNRMYWIDCGLRRIRSISFDTTDIDDLIFNTNYLWGLALDLTRGKMYWTESLYSNKIKRADLDGFNVEELITTGLSSPHSIVLDVDAEKMYWSEYSKICRASFDGNDVEDLIVDLSNALGLALDLINEKVYWTDFGTDKIQRANMDGTEVEDLITSGLDIPMGIVLDVSGGKMYFSDGGTDKIQRANLDGTMVEDLVTADVQSPEGIALDVAAGKMYWTDYGQGTIRRANLDGSNVEELLPLPPFTGSFEGNGYAISNFTYEVPGADYVGIFSVVSTPAEINNVNLIDPYVNIDWGQASGTLAGYKDGAGIISNCSVVNAYVNGGQYIGGLTGMNYGILKNCQVSGSVNGTLNTGGLVGYISSGGSEITDCSFAGNVQGDRQTGGLVGYNYGSIEKCYADANVNGTLHTGGLVGYLATPSYGEGLKNSFFAGDVNGTDSVGGLVGRQYGRVYSCYSDANVDGVSKVGGLAGESTGTVSGCYSCGMVNGSEDFGGLAGFGDGDNIFNSFWDIDTSGILISAGGIGLPTYEMQSASTYDVIWSCEVAQWTIDDGNDYPRLLWENQPGELIERYLYGGGSGTSDEPYLIYTAEHLNTIGLLACDSGSSFKLMADIDMADLNGVPFNMIGFDGIFDGNGHAVYNLTINADGYDYVGMFGSLGANGVVKDLCLENTFVDTNNCTYSAALAGRNEGLLYACCCDADVVDGGYIGALVGYNGTGGSIVNCYTTGSVEGQNYVSGLVGRNRGSIRQCYSATEVTGGQYTGGLVGYNDSQANIDSSFWDVDISGEPNGVGSGSVGDVIGKTTSEMQDSSTFLDAGWDFVGELINGPSDIWAEPKGAHYMILWWQLNPNDLPPLPTFSGGSGTSEAPYLISTVSDIGSIGHSPRLMDSHFLLVNDIDLAGFDFHQIGNGAYRFYGVFDGNWYEVFNLSMQRSFEDYVGFFGYTDSNCVIKNLGLIDPNITTEKCQYVGGLAGLSNDTTIINCYFSGTVTGDNIGYGSIGVGGLLGRSVGSTLQGCFTEGVALATSEYSYAGGLVNSFSDSNAVNCFSTMSVTSYEQSGGLFSSCRLGRVENCYASGRVDATYYNGEEGGLLGSYYDSEFQNCFWDINTTGRTTAIGGSSFVIASGKTTAEMLTASTFTEAGWDFVNTWDIIEGVCYPYIQGLPGPKPFKAHSFVPEDGSDYVSIGVEICFGAGVGATSHDIYLGTTNPPPFICNQTELSYSPGLLDKYTTYYWRIDEVGPFGITTGETLSFKTGAWLGSGVEDDPFLIQNTVDLLAVSIDPNATSAYSELTANIYLPYGVYEPFSLQGVLDGNGHSIFNFHHSDSGGEVGFFSNISGTVRNLTLINPTVDGGSSDKIGALAGSMSSSGRIENCHVENAVVSGNNYVGGLVGYAGNYSLYSRWAGFISNCSSSGIVTGNDYVGGITGIGRAVDSYASCTVSGTNRIGGLIGYGVFKTSNCGAEGTVSGSDYVGGLIGRTYNLDYYATTLENSCAVGNVTGNTWVGGLIGLQSEGISNCYARGDVDGVTNVGGLCGGCGSLLFNCYSTGEVTGTTDVGGLVGGSSSPSYFSCFWDIEISGQTSSAAGRGKTTELMKSEITYAGFGCDEVWTIDDGNDYPYLFWESKPGQLITKPVYGGGAGAPEDPYLIYTAEQMSIIGLVLCDNDKHFKLMADIDMSYYDGIDGRPNYNIIGYVNPRAGLGRYLQFSGVFDGCYHTISNLHLNETGEKNVGCFGCVDGYYSSSNQVLAEVKNLGIIDPNIVDTSLIDHKTIGSLVGILRYGRVSNCYVSGGSIYVTALSDYSQDAFVGGLVGYNGGSMIESFSACSTFGAGQWCDVGGLVGFNYRNIIDCYSNSSVEGYYSGGLVGVNYEGTILNCYSTGPVSSNRGLVGNNDEGIIEASYWDVQTSGCTFSDGGIGLTTEEMQNPSIFLNAGWDFMNEGNNGKEDIWRLCSAGAEYPQLNWRYAKGDIVCPDGVGSNDFDVLCSQWLYILLPEEIDFHKDNSIDFLDWAVFAAAWQSRSYSPNWNPACDIWPEGGDDRVDEGDLALFLEFWLESGHHYIQANITPESAIEGIVNMVDFAVFAGNWLEGF